MPVVGKVTVTLPHPDAGHLIIGKAHNKMNAGGRKKKSNTQLPEKLTPTDPNPVTDLVEEMNNDPQPPTDPPLPDHGPAASPAEAPLLGESEVGGVHVPATVVGEESQLARDLVVASSPVDPSLATMAPAPSDGQLLARLAQKPLRTIRDAQDNDPFASAMKQYLMAKDLPSSDPCGTKS